MVAHLPNLLSAARLIAAPYIFQLLYSREYKTALVWFAIIGATDGADGYLARKFDAQSRLGAMLDPVADKVLLSGSFLVLALTGTVPPWLAVLVLGRDALILLFALVVLALSKARREFPPSTAGKLSTALQILYVLTVTASRAGYIPVSVDDVLKWAVAAVTAWSGLDYVRRGLVTRASDEV